MNLPIAILAGGLGRRMLPLTEKMPKSLIRVAGDYFICHQLRYLRQQGLKKVVLCIGHLGEQIEAILGDGQAFGLNLSYSWDGPQLLGTGGALKQALPLLTEAFFVLYGDSYLPIDFGSVEKKFYESAKAGLMTIFKNNNRWDKSNVIFENNLILEYNKYQQRAAMDYIDSGLSILRARALQEFPAQVPFDLAALYQDLAQGHELIGHEVFERFYEVGSKEGLAELKALISPH